MLQIAVLIPKHSGDTGAAESELRVAVRATGCAKRVTLVVALHEGSANAQEVKLGCDVAATATTAYVVATSAPQLAALL